MAPPPYKPEDEEVNKYFYGFSGNPRLVARTGHDRWVKSLSTEAGWGQRLVQDRKYYLAVQDPEIIKKWNKDKELSIQIMGLLDQCNWSYFFPVRTGLRDDYNHPKGVPATILLIAVEPGSLQWEAGIKIALSCRDLIQRLGIFDVEVEIMEGRYTEYAASIELEPFFDRKDVIGKHILPLLPYLGYPIAYLEDKKGQGTMGLHVKLGNDPKIYGLTCRHVVWNDRKAHESYKSSEDKSSEDNRQFHIQANQTTFYDIQHKLDLKKKGIEELIKPRELRISKWDEIYQWDPPRNVPPPNENDRQQLATLKGNLTRYASTLRVLEKYNERKDRQIGHLAFLQSFTLSPRQLGYFRDWALIELDLSKFPRAPDNKVALNLPGEIANPIELPFPEQELVLPNADTTSPKFVVKRGATTGLTVGQMSAIEAVIRRPGHGEDKDVFTWELLVIPGSGPLGEVNVADRFSYKGDSGSAIFDGSGTIVGIVTAGNGSGDWRGVPDKQTSSSQEYRKLKGGLKIAPQNADKTPTSERVEMPIGTDITFAHPIKWVLDDIEEFTGQKVQLA
ncbi:hypothetical protein EKO27_g3846 [Xylaria grammica]|uniref:Serine protease n=1 Tax=Xylaria grammica TaxID=363999 RepID=A0A439D9Z1_9PEZI|nr:hypothetical protein EKO27_g3846 [Xylaria grammica]